MTFPEHIALTLSHNEHATVYETVEHYYEDGRRGDWSFDWVNPEQKAKAIATQSVWELHWYPNTPVGFNVLLACDLDVLLAEAPC